MGKLIKAIQDFERAFLEENMMPPVMVYLPKDTGQRLMHELSRYSGYNGEMWLPGMCKVSGIAFKWPEPFGAKQVTLDMEYLEKARKD